MVSPRCQVPHLQISVVPNFTALAGYIRRGYSHSMARDPHAQLPLTPVVLHILLALADGERHGYAIAQVIEETTQGLVRMGPGTLYGSIQRMLASSLIEETSSRRRASDDSGSDDPRRRYYRATSFGRRVLTLELERLSAIVTVARQKQLVGGAKPA